MPDAFFFQQFDKRLVMVNVVTDVAYAISTNHDNWHQVQKTKGYNQPFELIVPFYEVL